MQVGDVMECALLDNDGKSTGEFSPVTVCQVKRHWQTGEPESVRVKTKRGRKESWVWVQASMLRPIQDAAAGADQGEATGGDQNDAGSADQD